MKITLTFAIHDGARLVRRESIAQDIVRVGRGPTNHLRVDDASVLREHAVIRVVSIDDIMLVGVSDESATLVNGVCVKECNVRAGDRIQVGGVSIVLESVREASVVRSAVVGSSSVDRFGAFGDELFAPMVANPFSVEAHSFGEVLEDGLRGSDGVRYVLTKSGPDVDVSEVETNAPAVEVMVMWGDMVLHVSHLSPPRDFYVGEEHAKGVRNGCFVPSEKLGATRAPIVLVKNSVVSFVLLPGAKGSVDVAGVGKKSFEDLIASGEAVPCGRHAGSYEVVLPAGAKARMEIGGSTSSNGLVFLVSTVNAGRRAATGLFSSARDVSTLFYVGLSMSVHAGLLAAMALLIPTTGLIDDGVVREDQLYLMKQYLQASSERDVEQREVERISDESVDSADGGRGARAVGDEGSMGNPNSRDSNRRYGVLGPKDNPDPHIARSAALREATEFGMISLLSAGAGGDPNSPTALWGRDDSLGTDSMSARGSMWGDSIGDAAGMGGLGLSGVGEGGGGRSESIGLGSIGTIGRGSGTGDGQGFGSGVRARGVHKVKPPRMAVGTTTVTGRISPEVIQRIVRQNFGRFRACYENGLRSNPSLGGRVSVRFVIGRDGSVLQVGNAGSDLPDQGVIQCVSQAYYGLSFPQPDGGIVSVVYPIIFQPGS